jgi:anti-anti-sigma factor
VRPLARLDLLSDEGVMIASLGGEIDLSNAEGLRHEIAEAIPNDSAGLVIDLSGVGYLDSSGLRLLFDMVRRVERRQQRMATVVPRSSHLRELLVISGGISRLAVQDTLDDALARVRGEEPARRSSECPQGG